MNEYYDLIALDWNGTLLNDAKLSAQCISKVAEHFEKPSVSLAKYREAFRFPIIEYYKKIGLEDYFSDASRMFFDLYNERKNALCLFNDAVNFIEFCGTIAKHVVILTAGKRSIIQDEVFNHFIDLPVWGSEGMPSLGKLSTAQELDEWICYQTGFNKPKVLLVGDTIEDTCCAYTFGWECYAVATGHCSRSRLLKNAQCVSDSLTDVKEYIHSEKLRYIFFD